MKTIAIIGTESIKPLDPKTYQGSDWGLIILTMIVAPLTLAVFQELFKIIQGRTKQQEKTEDSRLKGEERVLEKSLASQESLLTTFQQQNTQLLNEVISARDEDMKNLQATMTTTMQVVATVSENMKAYAEMAIKRSEETRQILDKIQTASERTVIESINSHIRINQRNLQNQDKIIAALKEQRELIKSIVELLEALKRQ